MTRRDPIEALEEIEHDKVDAAYEIELVLD
jgi:hypothetical protein